MGMDLKTARDNNFFIEKKTDLSQGRAIILTRWAALLLPGEIKTLHDY